MDGKECRIIGYIAPDDLESIRYSPYCEKAEITVLAYAGYVPSYAKVNILEPIGIKKPG